MEREREGENESSLTHHLSLADSSYTEASSLIIHNMVKFVTGPRKERIEGEEEETENGK